MSWSTLSRGSGASRALTIAGLVDFGNKGVNTRAGYVALRTAQSLLGLRGGATTIGVAQSARVHQSVLSEAPRCSFMTSARRSHTRINNKSPP